VSLEDYGWDESWAKHLTDSDASQSVPARVISAHRSTYRVHTGEQELSAKAAGRLFHAPFRQSELPVVGDWVILDGSSKNSRATIKHVLPRISTFSRKVAGKNTNEQVMATNLDTVWIVSTFDGDLNPARLERYISLVADSGAVPVIVIAKADLVEETEATIETLRERIPDVPMHAVSVKAGIGLEALDQYVSPGHTIALLGSSGVGKSTLINHFMGYERLQTAEVREKDGKGRHTTTHRELILLPSGGLLLDTPGMRELQLWVGDDNLEKSFSDIDEIAANCRFDDCAHETEPGCAVNAAVASGELPEERFNNYKKLRQELSFLDRKNDPKVFSVERERWKAVSKEQRRYSKEHRSKGKR